MLVSVGGCLQVQGPSIRVAGEVEAVRRPPTTWLPVRGDIHANKKSMSGGAHSLSLSSTTTEADIHTSGRL